MNPKLIRALVAVVLILAAGGVGYVLGGNKNTVAGTCVSIPSQTIAAPASGAVRVIYSLDQKQNDKEIIALINAAQTHIYFAMYEFTLKDIADALVAAKKRGVEVRGLVDAVEAADSYDQPIMTELAQAGIPVEIEKHADGNGIMHIKAIVTDQAYALGSYNWTGSATTENDELLEIGTDPNLRQVYDDMLKKLLTAYQGNAAASAAASVYSEQSRTDSIGTITPATAPAHVGSLASVRGTLVDAHTTSTGTVFLDFCKSYTTCPFSGVIFADDAKKFGSLTSDIGTTVTLTGMISSYQGKAEIILSDPSQLAR
jgi:hypothetical protein